MRDANLFFYRVLFIVFAISFVLTSCRKEGNFFYNDLDSDEIQLHYNETQCADPWTQFFLDKKDEKQEDWENPEYKAVMLKEFLNMKNISVLDVKYVMADDSDVVTCTGCQCYTGAVFYVKALRDDIIIKNLVDLGFIITE